MKCETCDAAGGFCEPHQVKKSRYRVHLCRTNKSYQQAWKEGRGPGQVSNQSRHARAPLGPGGELARLLRQRFGEEERPGCKCRQWAAKMDRWGPDGCRKNMRLIVAKLIDEARQRGHAAAWLPGAGLAVRRLIVVAIRRAERGACLACSPQLPEATP